MKYLIYTEDFPDFTPGAARQTGIGRYCYDLACGLVAAGKQVVMLTHQACGPTSPPPEHVAELIRIGRRPRRPSDVPMRAKAIREAIRRIAPDCVIVGDPDGHRVLSWPGRSLDVPHYPVFYGTELRGLRRTSDARSPGAWVRSRLMRSYIARAAERICISRYTRGELRSLLTDEHSACVVHPAVGALFLTRPRNQSFRLPGDDLGEQRPLRLITIGRISERKNQLQVLEMLASIRRQRGLRFQYYILGNVDSPAHAGYRGEIERFVRSQGLEDSVWIVPGTTEEEKIDYLDRCDVFVMLSRTAGDSVEGFGISAIEASCRGRPVVVSNEGGMPETIVEGVTGFSVSPNDPSAAIEALTRLAESPALRVEMGDAGAKHVRGNFTPIAMGESLNRCLAGRSTARHGRD